MKSANDEDNLITCQPCKGTGYIEIVIPEAMIWDSNLCNACNGMGSVPATEKYENYRVHAQAFCKPPCPFHEPSDHALKDAPMNIRSDKNFLVERVCEHGVGHDDPDSANYMRAQGHGWAGTHGCDGCCV